ncbi:MAG: ribosome silencing factor [Alphaproteobacteria bacterium]|nr:ribosome silencing factor [Alphaproteobacteria bacterium]HCP00601.1 ribosome silencing factor [Rhodospirillaceae bacterium]
MARKQKASSQPTAEALLALVEQSLDDNKADDIKVIPLEGKSDIADFMVVASGTSGRRLDSITEHLLGRLKTAGVKGMHAEGRQSGEWVLVDAGDVIVHLFRPEFREHYAIEKLWEAEFSNRVSQEAWPA